MAAFRVFVPEGVRGWLRVSNPVGGCRDEPSAHWAVGDTAGLETCATLASKAGMSGRAVERNGWTNLPAGRVIRATMRRESDLRRLYDEHAQPLYAFLLNLTRNEADTRDLLQDIFIKLARVPDLLASVRDERAFLIPQAHNAAIDLIRRRGTRDKTREHFAALAGGHRGIDWFA